MAIRRRNRKALGQSRARKASKGTKRGSRTTRTTGRR